MKANVGTVKKEKIMKSMLVALAVGLMISGCGQHKTADVRKATPPLQGSELTDEKVIEIARKAVQSNDTWADRAKFEAKKNADGMWSVTVWRIEGYDKDGKPQFVPGGHRFITINRQGNVIDYMRGK